ncbi:cytochrome P450 4X1 isoform X3 [Meriones unguiculatus]|uniref:cytochrome P450 4X1 isoform X3 n=1 Tax=Meriones unguiculatus TaxID=10047 RepID=UPI00293E111B|nr:cytochrome P450 4X1 isoform X3 [Meriones unguiculatus]
MTPAGALFQNLNSAPLRPERSHFKIRHPGKVQEACLNPGVRRRADAAGWPLLPRQAPPLPRRSHTQGSPGRGPGDAPRFPPRPHLPTHRPRDSGSGAMEASWLETRWARPLHLALVFCLALALMQAFKLYLRRRRLLRDLSPFPGPPAHWLLGHQKFLQEDNMEKLDEIVRTYPCAFPCWVGPFQAFFYIYDPDYAKIFLSRTDPKTQYVHQFMTPCIGRGLLNLDGPRWFQHRCLLTPAFHQDMLKPCVDMMAHSVNTMLDKWEKMWTTQETTMEVFEHINLMALDIIMKCAFGQETNCQINGTYEPYVKATFELGEIVSSHLYNFWHHHDIIFKFSSKGHSFQELGKVIHQYTEKIIQDRKKLLKDGVKQDDSQKSQNFLDIVLSAQAEDERAFSDADLRSEVNTFMWAGHDASAASISWLLYCLALNPEHQDRCRTEIRSILGDGSSITWGKQHYQATEDDNAATPDET